MGSAGPCFPRSRPLQAPHPPTPASSRRQASDLTSPSPHQDAGPLPPAERRQDLPPAGGASAGRCRRGAGAGAPAHHPR